MGLVRSLKLWLCLMGLGVGLLAWAEAQGEELNWMAYGDLRGYLQTCGCDPRTDLGGVARLATILTRERAAHSDAVVFDLGNNFSFGPVDKLKDQYIEQGLTLLKADAALVNRSEIAFAAQPYRQQRKLLLSNLIVRTPKSRSEGLGEEFIAGEKFVALGYVWHETLTQRTLPWSPKLKTQFEGILKRHAGKQRVLLFAGPRQHLQDIAASKLFDLIISSNDSPDAEKPSFDEHEDPSLLVRLVEPLYVRMVPLGGVGLLRGGVLRQGEAKSVADMLGGGAKDMRAASPAASNQSPLDGLLPNGGGSLPAALANDISVTWLSRPYEDGSPLEDFIKRYEKAAAAAFASRSQERLKDLATSPFAGAQACQSCHPQAYAAWASSKHAGAYRTLEKEQKHEDGECVSCHVLGYHDKGGFVSITATPQFAGVQCETCHGPRREHSTNPSIRPPQGQAAKDVCQSCHHNPHSPNFGFNSYWDKIKHGKEQPQP